MRDARGIAGALDRDQGARDVGARVERARSHALRVGPDRAAARLADARRPGRAPRSGGSRSGLQEHPVSVAMPADLPALYVDADLIVQMFVEPAGQRREVHAAWYAASTSPHRTTTSSCGDRRRRRARACRAGELERLFDKFQRGIGRRHDRRRRPRARDLPRNRARAWRRHPGRRPTWRRRAI